MKAFHIIKEQYLIWALQALTGLTFLVPLITYSNFYFPFITPRNFFFRIIVEVMVIVYVTLVLQNRTYLPRKQPLFIILSAFVVALSIASAIGGDFIHSFWSNYERMDGLVTLLHLFALLFMLYGTMRSRVEWERLLQISLCVAFAVSFVGLSQLLDVNILLASSGGGRIAATLGNATYLSTYLLIHLFIAAYFLLRSKEYAQLLVFQIGFGAMDLLITFVHIRYGLTQGADGLWTQIFSSPFLWLPFVGLQAIAFAPLALKNKTRATVLSQNILYVALSLLFIILITTTQTRGAIVGLVLSVVVAMVLLIFRKGERSFVRIGSAAVILLCGLGIWFVFANKDSALVKGNPLLNKIASISLNDATTRTRLVTWQTGLKGFRDKPIFGWGVENFDRPFNLYFPPVIYTDEGTPLWYDRPHNLLVQYLVEGGIIGFALYGALIGYAIVLLLRKQRHNYIGILFTIFFVAYIGSNFFVFDSLNSYIPFYLILGFIFFLTDNKKKTEAGNPAGAVSENIGLVAVTIVVLAAGFAVWSGTMKALAANTHFVKAYREMSNATSNKESVRASAEKLFEILDAAPYLGKAELLGVYSELVVGFLQDRTLSESDSKYMVDGLEKRFEEMRAIDQHDPRFNMFLMNLYINAAYVDPAYVERMLKLGEETLKLSPTRPQIFYLTGRAHMIRKECNQAVADFSKATDLAPDVYDAQWNLFAAYLTPSDCQSNTEADAILKKLRTLKQFDVMTYSRIISLYAVTKHYDNAERIALEAVAKFPDTADLLVLLANVYAAEGKNKEARETILKVATLNPELKVQVDEFIRQLDSGTLLRTQP